ncbi:MAG: KUP/HAK/KT family potassium transporter [Solirubrobacterales bacterium]|nr:KUP/HAK/KT family potassium transporter [Solirubrobacterales bacterium]
MSDIRRRILDEGAHKLGAEARGDGAGSPTRSGLRRSFNEAAHKLGQWPVHPAPPPEDLRPSAALTAAADPERDVVAHAGRAVLALGALGVVYGDIGTSPLYTEQVIFTQHRAAAHATVAGVYGVVSLIFWALTVVVTIKYAGFIMRAQRSGDGGIMALTALIRRRKVVHAAVLVTLGIFGASLFFGDGMITPAISVLSAVEGLKVVDPGLGHLVVPISLGILIGLFAIQRKGTGAVGWLFGPVIMVWFAVLAIVGGHEVLQHPGVLQGLSPVWGARFMLDHGAAAFLALGGVVLAVTGAETLYADRGHFGAGAIRFTWLTIVFPALMLNYLGQAALILAHPSSVSNPFLLLVPGWGRFPMVFLATAATIIASQAAITGSFSVARQAVQLGFLPRLNILHTSDLEGQIYVPVVNWGLGIGVAVLVLVFQASVKLADIYGVAVTGTFILNTLLFIAVARSLWMTPRWRLALLGALFLTVEVAFFSSNLAKVAHGAWLSLGVGLVISIFMNTWRWGREIVTRNRTEQEGSLEEFLHGLPAAEPPIRRVPGVAIFLNPGKQTTPLALRAEVEHSHALHEKVVIVSVETISIPHVDRGDRFVVELVGRGLFKIFYVTVRCGYQDRQNVPQALQLCRKQGLLERNLDLEHASYFLSRITITPTDATVLKGWRQRLFVVMARNAASPIEHFGLPSQRTVMVGWRISV